MSESSFEKRDPKLWKDNAKVSATLLKESDRGCIIFVSGIIEDALDALLRASFRGDTAVIKKIIDPLFNAYGPIATFSAKINLCFAFGLIDEILRRKLELLRKIRNDCAHEAGHIDFAHSKIKPRLDVFLAKKSKHDREALETMLDVGNQRLSKAQLTDRLVFILNIWDILGAIRLLAEMSKHHFQKRVSDNTKIQEKLKQKFDSLK
jgi:DNA-binding MltR family transcriptional regulator